MTRIIVLCHGGCGTHIETSPSHRHNAVCPECRRIANIASTRRAQRRRKGQADNIKVMTAEKILEWAYWGN